MDTSELFKIASRKKFRFDTSKGLVTVEDLWDLALTSSRNAPNLDDIAQALYAQVREADSNVSFVNPVTTDNQVRLKLDLVKHIIDTKLHERAVAHDAAVKAARRQKLMEIIERKQDNALEGATLEELQAMLDAE